MRQSKLNTPYRLNADGQDLPAVIYGGEYTQLPADYFGTSSASDGSTPWYGYIGSWLGGVGNLIAGTKDPADIHYHNYSQGGSSSALIWILLAVVAVVAVLFFIKK